MAQRIIDSATGKWKIGSLGQQIVRESEQECPSDCDCCWYLAELCECETETPDFDIYVPCALVDAHPNGGTDIFFRYGSACYHVNDTDDTYTSVPEGDVSLAGFATEMDSCDECCNPDAECASDDDCAHYFANCPSSYSLNVNVTATRLSDGKTCSLSGTGIADTIIGQPEKCDPPTACVYWFDPFPVPDVLPRFRLETYDPSGLHCCQATTPPGAPVYDNLALYLECDDFTVPVGFTKERFSGECIATGSYTINAAPAGFTISGSCVVS